MKVKDKKQPAVNALPNGELLAALKGNYVSQRESATAALIALPTPPPETVERKIELPRVLAKLLDEYIAYTIESNGVELSELVRKQYAPHIQTELLRLAIASDKNFEKQLANKALENTPESASSNGHHNTNSNGGGDKLESVSGVAAG